MLRGLFWGRGNGKRGGVGEVRRGEGRRVRGFRTTVTSSLFSLCHHLSAGSDVCLRSSPSPSPAAPLFSSTSSQHSPARSPSHSARQARYDSVEACLFFVSVWIHSSLCLTSSSSFICSLFSGWTCSFRDVCPLWTASTFLQLSPSVGVVSCCSFTSSVSTRLFFSSLSFERARPGSRWRRWYEISFSFLLQWFKNVRIVRKVWLKLW